MAATNEPHSPDETKTSIDSLVELLKARGKTELTAISVALGTDPKIVERWAKVLESGGLAKISYEVGKMYLEPVTISKEEVQEVRAKLSAQKVILDEDLSLQQVSIEKFMEYLNNISTQVSSVEKAYQERMPEVQRMLSELNKIYDIVNSNDKGVHDVANRAEQVYEGIEKKMDELNKKVVGFTAGDTVKSISSQTDRINEIISKSHATQASLEEIRKGKDKFFEAVRHSVDAQIKDINRQIDAASKQIDSQITAQSRQLAQETKGLRQQADSAKGLANQINSFRKEGENARRMISSARSEFTDRYQKLHTSIVQETKLVEEKSKPVIDQIDQIKSAFGGAVELDQKLRQLRGDADSMNAQLNSAKETVNKLKEELRALDALHAGSVERRSAMFSDLKGRSEESKKKISAVKKKLSETAEKLSKPGEK